MHPLRSIRRVALGAALTGAAIGAVPAMASAASSCTYNPSTRTATVTVDDSGARSLTIARSGPLIAVDTNQLCISSGFEFATVSNTNTLVVNEIVTHNRDGVTIDESNGEFAPGFTPEADGHSELEIVVRKASGGASGSETTIVGTPGDDVIRIGRGAVSLQRDIQAGNDLDDDADLVLPPGVVAVAGGQGSDFLSGQGYGPRQPTDWGVILSGGVQDDTLLGGASGDLLFGDGGNDTLDSVDQVTDLVFGGADFDNARHDFRDTLGGVESSGQVGRLRLAPRVLRAEAGSTARLKMSWEHPKAWRELRKVQMKVYRGEKAVAVVDARPGRGSLSSTGAVELMSGSKLGHHGKWVTAKLAMRLPKSLAGADLRVDVQAADKQGDMQLERSAGVIHVAG